MKSAEDKRRHDAAVADIAYQLLTVADVAKIMKTSERTVYSYLSKGIIPGRKLGHQWYVYRPTLVALLIGEEV